MKKIILDKKSLLTFYLCFGFAIIIMSFKDPAQISFAPKQKFDTLPKDQHIDIDIKVGDLNAIIKTTVDAAEKSLKTIDWNNVSKQIETCLKAIDVYKIKTEVEASIKNINWNEIKTDIDKSLKEIDFHKIKIEINKSMSDLKKDLNPEKLKKEMEMHKKELRQAREEMERAKEELKRAKKEHGAV